MQSTSLSFAARSPLSCQGPSLLCQEVLLSCQGKSWLGLVRTDQHLQFRFKGLDQQVHDLESLLPRLTLTNSSKSPLLSPCSNLWHGSSMPSRWPHSPSQGLSTLRPQSSRWHTGTSQGKTSSSPPMPQGPSGLPQTGQAGNRPTESMSLLASKSASTRHTAGPAAVLRTTGTVSVGESAFLPDAQQALELGFIDGNIWAGTRDSRNGRRKCLAVSGTSVVASGTARMRKRFCMLIAGPGDGSWAVVSLWNLKLFCALEARDSTDPEMCAKLPYA